MHLFPSRCYDDNSCDGCVYFLVSVMMMIALMDMYVSTDVMMMIVVMDVFIMLATYICSGSW